MDESISSRLDETREQLLEHFDDEVHQKLKVSLKKVNHTLTNTKLGCGALPSII